MNSLPIVDADDHLVALVFRKDDSRKSNPEALDAQVFHVLLVDAVAQDHRNED